MRNIEWLGIALLTLSACAKTSGTPSTATAGKPAKAAAGASTPDAPVTKDGITVLEASVCRAVEERAAVGAATTFPPDVGRLYFFTKVTIEGGNESTIKHVWHYAGKPLATVTLPVRTSQWRTYSSKAVDPTWKGEWRVDLVSPNDQVIKSVTFKIE